MKILNRLFLVIFCLLTMAPVWAEATALEVVKNTADQVIEKLKDEADQQKIKQVVNELIAPNFDFPKMSRWVLGKNWRKATPEQKKRFTEAFEDLLIKTYSNALTKADGVDIKYLPVHSSENSKKVTVKTEVDRKNGSPKVPINYRLYKSKKGGWKVYDVSIDGVSLVSTYRKSFNSEIKKGGLDKLIQHLEARTRS